MAGSFVQTSDKTTPGERDADTGPERNGSRGPIRVLHCLWHGETGGAERSVYQLARAQMRDPEISPGLLFAQGRGAYWEEAQKLGCPVVSLNIRNARSPRCITRAAEVMREFSVHHFHSAEPLLMLGSVRCRGAQRVYTHRGGDTVYPLRRELRYRITGHVLRRWFHGFSANSIHAVGSASQLLGVDHDRFVVTYNGLDFGLLEPTRSAAEVREELGLSTAEFVIGTAANLRPWKRVDRLLRAAHSMGRSDVRVLVLGDGPDMPRLRRVVRDLDSEERVVFAGLRSHVGNDLQVMDAFCLPSDALESFGNAAVEAMGMGAPTIVFSDSPGLTEHIQSGRTGFIVDDEAQLRDTLLELMADRDYARTIGEAGRLAVRERYRMDGATGNYRRLYRSLAVGTPP
jgi:glycosyltransferase involved in cell wall biosynthesis